MQTLVKYNSLYDEMETYLCKVARSQQFTYQPIYLVTHYHHGLKLIDIDKRQYIVQELYLSVFRDIYTNNLYNMVRINNWQFQTEFIGKKCVKISIVASLVIFITSKNIKHQIDGCLFKFTVVEGQIALNKLPKTIKGYLNRIGKRNLCQVSHNIHQQMKSLISFINYSYTNYSKFCFTPWQAKKQTQIDPLLTLNQKGISVLQKLRHFVTRKSISKYLDNFQGSSKSINILCKIANNTYK